jgi:hypothetical protein
MGYRLDSTATGGRLGSESERERNLRWSAALVTFAILSGLATGAAAGSVLVVGDDADPATCGGNAAAYTTIGAALAEATPGDTILVCPGIYPEQLTVTTDGVTLEARTARTAIITAPPRLVQPRTLVRVSGAVDVTIRNFVIAAGGACDPPCRGVGVEGAGSVTLEGNDIRDLRASRFAPAVPGPAR